MSGHVILGNKLSYGDLKSPSSNVREVFCSSKSEYLSLKDGCVRVESGGSLSSVLEALSAGKRWLSVVPGTSQISIGGAIANDIHGKNQNYSGSFGSVVDSMVLRRSDGASHFLTPESPLFRATIGGLGCTGIIESVSLKVREIESPFIQVKQIRFSGLEEFLEIDETLKKSHEYTVGWIDVRDKKLRGVYLAGDHCKGSTNIGLFQERDKMERLLNPFGFPVQPFNLVSKLAIDSLRSFYYVTHTNKASKIEHFSDYFFPLDKIRNFKNAFGSRGMSQYQINISYEVPLSKWYLFLEMVRKSGKATFISVLKSFGEKKTPAYMTFAQKGISIAIDFVGDYAENATLFESFDKVFSGELIRWYPAKDGHMKYWQFEQSMGTENIRMWREHWDSAFLGSAWFERVIGNHLKV